MGQFATGITVVSTQVDDQPYGFTANSFASVSMEPPMILCCIKNESSFIEQLKIAKKFTVSILTVDQQDISNLFANPHIESNERFKLHKSKVSPLGNPIISNCLTWIDCELSELYQAGDHQICIGLVRHMSVEHKDDDPLLYYSGSYHRLE
ncbi:MAG: 3-hydroxy-9,10-secoandrosta-1,3,5(10)-triene-9,17-dione monooxygenase reductase component [Saprospiraceae bacterium]|jgi:3-hydroxy-9,10-secoandrosta-1,3,5(10)-triene-9,17-dione monooxygenase reductase component